MKQARQDGLDWYLLDLAVILDRLAQRRYIESPSARPDWWTPYELPPELAALDPVPNTGFFSPASTAQGRAVLPGRGPLDDDRVRDHRPGGHQPDAAGGGDVLQRGAGSPALAATAAPESKIKFVGFVVSKRSL